MEYTHEYSNYPDELIELVNYKNVDDTIGDLINQIESFRASGNYLGATQLIERYYPQLKPYLIENKDINAIIEEIRNTQIRAQGIVGQYLCIDGEEPLDKTDDLVWLGGNGNNYMSSPVNTDTIEPSAPIDGLIWIGGATDYE